MNKNTINTIKELSKGIRFDEFKDIFEEFKKIPFIFRVFVTPADAQWILEEHSGINRSLSTNEVKEILKDLVGGKWDDIMTPISFDSTGTLIDGNHRINALAKTNIKGIWMWVGTCNHRSIHQDVLRARTAADNLRYSGLITAEDVKVAFDSNTTSMMTYFAGWKLGHNKCRVAEYLQESTKANKELIVKFRKSFGDTPNAIAKPFRRASTLTALMTLFAQGEIDSKDIKRLNTLMAELVKNPNPDNEPDEARDCSIRSLFSVLKNVKGGGDFLGKQVHVTTLKVVRKWKAGKIVTVSVLDDPEEPIEVIDLTVPVKKSSKIGKKAA